VDGKELPYEEYDSSFYLYKESFSRKKHSAWIKKDSIER
jgi:hypothetical protein